MCGVVGSNAWTLALSVARCIRYLIGNWKMTENSTYRSLRLVPSSCHVTIEALTSSIEYSKTTASKSETIHL